MALVAAIAVYGISRIQINDNPVKWFSKRHPIRQADIELNKHFGGTYMAYLVLEETGERDIDTKFVGTMRDRWLKETVKLDDKTSVMAGEVENVIFSHGSGKKNEQQYIEELIATANEKLTAAEDAKRDAESDLWYEAVSFFETEKERLKIFKRPEMLEYMAGLQEHLQLSGLVGKSNSIVDVVKKVHQELIDGRPESYIIPQTSAAVAQCLLQFQSIPNTIFSCQTVLI